MTTMTSSPRVTEPTPWSRGKKGRSTHEQSCEVHGETGLQKTRQKGQQDPRRRPGSVPRPSFRTRGAAVPSGGDGSRVGSTGRHPYGYLQTAPTKPLGDSLSDTTRALTCHAGHQSAKTLSLRLQELTDQRSRSPAAPQGRSPRRWPTAEVRAEVKEMAGVRSKR